MLADEGILDRMSVEKGETLNFCCAGAANGDGEPN
jgi:hypothetical protein